MRLTARALQHLAEELHRRAAGAWVQRIYQPAPTVLVFHLHGAGARHVLVVDTAPARLAFGFLPERTPANPAQPPAFCMLLRKHLEGTRLAAAESVPEDRIVLLRFQRAGAPTAMLAVELTGRTANAILVVDGKTAGWLRTPGQGRALSLNAPYSLPLKRRAGEPPGETHAPGEPLEGAEAALEAEADLSLEQVGRQWLASFEHEQQETRRRALLRTLGEAGRRLERRLQRQEQDLRQAEDAERYRRFGELLLTFQRYVPARAAQVTLPPPDQSTGEEPVTIALDPSLSASQNAAACFRRYQKARRAVSVLQEAIARGRQHLAVLQTLEVLVREADEPATLHALESEAARVVAEASATPLRSDQTPARERAAQRETPRAPADGTAPPDRRKAVALWGTGQVLPVTRYRSSDGVEILVGRSARANDHVTFHLARPDHLWLHARGLPGAHVVVRVDADQVTPRTLQEAAALAAYFSAQGRSGVAVPVDYTRRRHVRKPPGSPPGFVFYDREHTLVVTPDPDALPPTK